MDNSHLTCRDERRRDDSRKAALYGLDFVEVGDEQTTLEVFFLGKAPPQVAKANVRIVGGSRVRDITATRLQVFRQPDPTLDDYMELVVDRPGDFSTYTLTLVELDEHGRPTDQIMDGFDPRFNAVQFTFKAGCPSDLDCRTPQLCPPAPREQPEINYLAKDYGSFRQLVLDRLALTMPDWQEGHVPDIGVALVEVLAYVGDYLSYYQDAVATEAYLDTARQRISVRRHARLVDYAMHEGCNARAWVTIKTDTDAELDPRQSFFAAGLPVDESTRVLQPDDFARLGSGSYELFEPIVSDPTQPIRIYAAHSEIYFYTWGDCQCCLPAGATSATLVDAWIAKDSGNGNAKTGGDSENVAYDIPMSGPREPGPTASKSRAVMLRPSTALVPLAREAEPPGDGPPGTVRALKLEAGDVLILEEVVGPGTGNPDDADPRHRQAVRLTKVTPAVDPLYHPYGEDFGQPIVEVEWCSEDALGFPLCLSAQMPPPDCTCRDRLSVAKGNVILVDNGARVGDPLGTVPTASSTDRCGTECEPPDTDVVAGRFHPALTRMPLTFAQPLPACGCASAFIPQDPRQALPQVWLTGTQPGAQGSLVTQWTAKRDLLDSNGDDFHFVVEIDDEGVAHLRFGDGSLGRSPEAGTVFEARYRVGNGPSGNVGRDSIRCIVFRQATDVGNLEPTNPLAAIGGRAPETIDEVKLFAPSAFRSVAQRAITGEDYAVIAADNARRLAQRPALLAAVTAVAATALPPIARPDDPRAAIEEEPGESHRLEPDICSIPFRRVQGAKGSLRWNGSWYEALVAVDPAGSEVADDELLDEINAYLEPFRRIGHDLEVRGADYVPLDLALAVCVKPQFLRGHVEAALLDVFSNRVLLDGSLGFFHPDNLTFGQGIYLSRIIAAAQAVPGVLEVQVTRLEPFEIGEPAPGVESAAEELPPGGVLALGPFEIARLDNDPSFPENGRLVLELRGGR